MKQDYLSGDYQTPEGSQVKQQLKNTSGVYTFILAINSTINNNAPEIQFQVASYLELYEEDEPVNGSIKRRVQGK